MSVHIRYNKPGSTTITATGKDAAIIFAGVSGQKKPSPMVDKVVIDQPAEVAERGKE